MNPKKVLELISAWCALRFFPTDVHGRAAVAKQVAEMCADIEQVEWLRDRLLVLFDDWPGPRTLRLVLCQKWKPADGLDIRGHCEQYPEGFPPLKPVEPPSLPKLGAGSKAPLALEAAANQLPPLPVPLDPRREAEFAGILEETLTPPEQRPKARLPRAQKQSEILRLADDPESEPRPAGTYKRITQADVDAAVDQLHAAEAHRKDVIH